MGIRGGLKTCFLVAASVMLLVVTGCGEKKSQESAKSADANVSAPATPGAPGQEGQGKLPEGHPPVDKTTEDITKVAHTNIKTQKEIKISDDVKAKWKEVKIEVTDSSQKKELLTLKVGNVVPLKKEPFKLKVEVFVPDYAISDNKILSRSNEPKNPAVLIDLMDGDKTVARGWIFKEFPEFNSYNDDRFQIALIAPASEKPLVKPAAKK